MIFNVSSNPNLSIFLLKIFPTHFPQGTFNKDLEVVVQSGQNRHASR